MSTFTFSTWDIFCTSSIFLFDFLPKVSLNVVPSLSRLHSPEERPVDDNVVWCLCPELCLSGYIQPAWPCWCRLLWLYGDWRGDLQTLLRAEKIHHRFCLKIKFESLFLVPLNILLKISKYSIVYQISSLSRNQIWSEVRLVQQRFTGFLFSFFTTIIIESTSYHF